MTDQERNQVLKMIEDGKISPEEGLHLMQALDQSVVEDAEPIKEIPAGGPPGPDQKVEPERSGMESDPRITRVKDAVKRLWQIPLWIGISITLLSALGMFLIMRGIGTNFWFYFLLLPLFFGVAVIALSVASITARWLFVDIHQKPGEHPEHIFFGFPLPLKLAAWFMRTFRRWIPDLDRGLGSANVDEMIQIFETGMGGESIIANVDDDEDGEKVRVYLG